MNCKGYFGLTGVCLKIIRKALCGLDYDRKKMSAKTFDAYFKKKAIDLAFLKKGLENRGHCLYFVGGCVRDALRDVQPKDYDLTTSAPADVVGSIIRTNNQRTVNVGLDHGTVGFFKGNEFYEITTFRREVDCDDRWKRSGFSDNLYQDSLRRDLTINALYLDFDGKVIDWHGGAEDVDNQIVRFVGDPHSRIKEDYLRILRFFRFATLFPVINFDAYSFLAATDACNLEGLKMISRERIREELFKIAAAQNAKQLFKVMIENDVLDKCGFIINDMDVFLEKLSIDLLAAFASQINSEEVEALSKKLVLSRKEKVGLKYLLKGNKQNKGIIDCLLDYHHYQVDRKDIIRLLKYTGKNENTFLKLAKHCPPYDGGYVQDKYGLQGADVGRKLLELRKQWLQVLLDQKNKSNETNR